MSDDSGIPLNIRRIMSALPGTGAAIRQPLFTRQQQDDAQFLIEAQNEGILPFPEPTPMRPGRHADEIIMVIETDLSVSAALGQAREYLELAGYHPVQAAEKQKRDAALCYTRGSTIRAMLTDSPKQVETEVAITAHPLPGTPQTCVEIRYTLTIPPVWFVTVPERKFWIAEMRELGRAVTGEALNRDDSQKQTREIHRSKASSCCSCYLVVILTMGMLWLAVVFNPQGAELHQHFVWMTIAAALPVVIFAGHFAAAWRWSR
jgi:hypothetical protein